MNEQTELTDPSMSRVAKRWTANIINNGGGFTPVANLFLQSYAKLDPALTPTEAMLVIHMMSKKWDRKPVAISSEVLAEEMNLTSGQVRQKLRDLEAKGVITSQGVPGRPKVFDFKPLLVKLEAVIKYDPADEEEDENYFMEIAREAQQHKQALRGNNPGEQQTKTPAANEDIEEFDLF